MYWFNVADLSGLLSIMLLPGHHTPLYSVGVSYGASRKKYSKNLEKWSSFHNFCPIIQFSEKIEKFEFLNLKLL